jgi:phage repressor protein C with HTH and peptisase S24 domain
MFMTRHYSSAVESATSLLDGARARDHSAMLATPMGRKVEWLLSQPEVSVADVVRATGVSGPTAVSEWKRTGRMAKRHIPVLARLTKTREVWWLTDDAPIPPTGEWVQPDYDLVLTDAAGRTTLVEAKSTASSDRNLTLLGDAYAQAQMLSLRPGEMWLPQYEGVRAMMGEGSDGASDVVTLVRVSEEGLRQRLIRTTFTSLKNLKLLSAYGDSMAGTFEDGDVLLVDSGVSAVDRDGVYVYSRDGELLVKRLQREDDGSLTVISDNPRYRDRRIARGDREAYQVHGRALLAWTAKVL